MSARPAPTRGAISGSTHRFPVRVYYEDTDAGGMVYHASYLRFAERARTETLRRLGIEHRRLRDRDGLAFVVRRCLVDFLAAARLDDELIVATRLGALGGAVLDLVQEVRRDDRLLVRLELRIACIGRTGRPARLPSALRAALLPLGPTPEMVPAHAS